VARLARFLVWLVALEALWGVFVGTIQSTELIAGVGAAAVATLFVELLRAQGLLAFRLEPGIVARAWRIPPQVVFDFVLVCWVLVASLARGRRVRGEWVSIDFATKDGAQGRFQRAVAIALENETPNAIVVDLDHGKALLHSLDARVSTGRSLL
jgi:multisubunit Na+/H+ antiporter MnhE subunit